MTNCLSSQPTTYYKTNNKCTVLHSLVLAYIRIFRSVFTAFGDEVLFCTRQFSSKSRVNCVKISCSTIHQLGRALLVISGCGVQSLKTIHRDSVKMGQTKCAILILVLSLKTNFISVFSFNLLTPLVHFEGTYFDCGKLSWPIFPPKLS